MKKIEKNLVTIENDFERNLYRGKDVMLDYSYMCMILDTLDYLHQENKFMKDFLKTKGFEVITK